MASHRVNRAGTGGEYMRLINADALWNELEILYEQKKGKVNWNDALMEIKTAPTIEPERKKGNRINHGRWLWLDGVRCSNCNHKLQTTGLTSYCPNCGSDMRG